MPKDKELIVVTDPENKDIVFSFFYYVDTEKTSYRSTNLHRVLCMWMNGYSKDSSEVTNVGKLG